MPRSTRLALAGVFYLAAVAGLFALLWRFDGSDDYAGWAPTIAALTLPACVVIARGGPRLGWAAAAAIGVPAGMCLGGVTLLMLVPVLQIYPRGDLTAVLGMLVFGPVAMAILAAVLVRRLHDLPVRVGARRVVAVAAVSGAVALLASSRGWWGVWSAAPGFDSMFAALFLLLGAAPLGWSLGPALALLATRE
jgi:hypothetical protein